MKSFFKKTATLLLGISFAFTGVACFGSEDETKAPGGTTPGGTTPGGTTPGGTTPGGTTQIVGASYVQGATQQIEQAKGAKITLDGEFSQTVNGVDLTIDVDGSLTLAATDTGFNAALEVSATSGEEVIGETKAFYLDGCLYAYDESMESYLFSPVYVPTEAVLEMMIESFTENILGAPIPYSALKSFITTVGENLPLGDGLIDGGEFNPEQAIAEIAKVLEENGAIQEDSKLLVSKEYSAKEKLSSIVEVINGIDETTTSIESLLNTYVLPLIYPELTLDDLIVVVSQVAKLTVSEAFEALDGFLKLNYEKGLQDVWDQAMNNDMVKYVLAQFLSEENIEMLSSLKLDELLKRKMEGDKVLGEYTLFEVAKAVYEYFGPQAYVADNTDGVGEGTTEGDSTVQDPVDEFFAMIKSYASETSLAEMGISLPAWDDLTFTVAKAVGEAKFGADYKLISAKAGVEFGVTGLPVKDQAKDASALSAKLYVGVEEISSVAAEIALPEDASTAFYLGIPVEGTGIEGYTCVVSSGYVYSKSDDAESLKYYFYVVVKNEAGDEISYTFEANGTNELPTEMELKSKTDADSTFKVTFDFKNGTVDLSALADVVKAGFAPADSADSTDSATDAA